MNYPKGLPYIIGNEAAERFSYYGMKCILIIYMTQYLRAADGSLATMTEPEAKFWYHLFGTANYLFPILGALIADIFWGKYKTIIILSLVYCAGHFVLAIDETAIGLSIGLTLIAIGSGGIKPCVSAHVGDQFDQTTAALVERAYSYFYLSINLGAFISTLLTPLFLEFYGPSVAFGVPGLFMLLATFVFWLGRHRFIALPPVGWRSYREALFSEHGKAAVLKLSLFFSCVAVFWSLFDQTGSSWVLQAERLDRNVTLSLGTWQHSFEVLPSQLQSLNPTLILIFVPLFNFVIYPFVERFIELNVTRKIALGMVLAASSFLVLAYAEWLLRSSHSVTIAWQILAYVLLTAGEVMISITALEYAYTQAPIAMKSFLMGFYMLSVAGGNLIASLTNFALTTEALSPYLQGPSYFVFFALLMIATLGVFMICKRNFTEEMIVVHREDFFEAAR